jgi:digeranylgeranylglycerophospholipid reductase
MKYDHDIIIVGAGPAGLLAGYYAASAGADTLIIDKKHELGKPVRCGEAAIENIFSDFNLKPKKEIISNKVNCLKCLSSMGKKMNVELNLNGYILDRVKFEQYLGSRTINKGAKIKLKTTVIGIKNNKIYITSDNGKTVKTVTAMIIIAADGVESRLGRWGGIDTTLKPKDIAVCYQYVLDNIEIEKHTVEFYWGKKYSPHGYIWVFPKSDNTANVGIVTLGNIELDLKQALKKFISERAPKSKILRSVAGCVPQAIPPKTVVKNNMMLVGDAARMAIPVTGGGIGHAMLSGQWSGELAGMTIKEGLSINNLTELDPKIHKLSKKIKRAYIIKEKIERDDDFFELLFGIFAPLPYIYKLSPSFIEKFALKTLRYVSDH